MRLIAIEHLPPANLAARLFIKTVATGNNQNRIRNDYANNNNNNDNNALLTTPTIVLAQTLRRPIV